MTQAPAIFDTGLLARRMAGRETPDFISTLVSEDLIDRLALITRDVERAALFAPDPTGLPTSARTANGPFTFDLFATLHAPDGRKSLLPPRFSMPHDDYQLIVSLLDIQIINDLPGFLETIRHHLRPDGLFIAAAIGGRTLTELREAWLEADVEMSGGASPRVAPMLDVRDAGMLLQRAGFNLPVTDLETHTVRYDNAFALMQDLKRLGATNPLVNRHPGLTTARRLMRAAELYGEKFSDSDGKVRATLEILWLSGWAPHESQQKPLKPGSATTRLRDILGDKS